MIKKIFWKSHVNLWIVGSSDKIIDRNIEIVSYGAEDFKAWGALRSFHHSYCRICNPDNFSQRLLRNFPLFS